MATTLGLNAIRRSAFGGADDRPKFRISLRCGSIGVRADQKTAIRLAHGFESVTPDAKFLADLSDECSTRRVKLRYVGSVYPSIRLATEFDQVQPTTLRANRCHRPVVGPEGGHLVCARGGADENVDGDEVAEDDAVFGVTADAGDHRLTPAVQARIQVRPAIRHHTSQPLCTLRQILGGRRNLSNPVFNDRRDAPALREWSGGLLGPCQGARKDRQRTQRRKVVGRGSGLSASQLIKTGIEVTVEPGGGLSVPDEIDRCQEFIPVCETDKC